LESIGQASGGDVGVEYSAVVESVSCGSGGGAGGRAGAAGVEWCDGVWCSGVGRVGARGVGEIAIWAPSRRCMGLRRCDWIEMSWADKKLREAAEKGDVAEIEAALRGGAAVNAVGHADSTDDVFTPLLWAAQGGHVAAFRALLAAGADPTAVCDGKSVVRLAIFGGNVQLIREAVAAREAVATSLPPLHVAATADDDGAAVRAVLDAATDVAARLALVTATCSEADRGGTALHIAAACGHMGAVRALLAARADVHGKDVVDSRTLHIASWNGHADAIKALLAGGADVNQATEDGATPLHAASEKGHVEAVKALLAGGAAVNAADKYVWTPLHWASAHGHLDAVRALLDAGADPCITDHLGKLVLDVVCLICFTDRTAKAPAITTLLRCAMAWRRRSAAVVACATEMWEESW